MSIKEHLIKLAVELNNTHSTEFSWSKEHGFPNFVTDETHGYQIKFTHIALMHLNKLSLVLYENRSKNTPRIELKIYTKCTRQIVANMFALGKLDSQLIEGDKVIIRELKCAIEEYIKNKTTAFTHYFPAWTLGLESDKPFEFGPIMLISRKDWLSTVDFPQNAKDMYFGGKEENNRWKEIVAELLDGKSSQDYPLSLATEIYPAIKHCPSLVKVTINGFEKDFSRKLAIIVAKTALDSISLLLGNDKLFLQQAIYGERLIPIDSYSLIETDGYLWGPGNGLSDRVVCHSKQTFEDYLDKSKSVIPPLVSILHGLLAPEQHPSPELAMRWATALNWLAEGCRESNDSIAMAKLGSSLDVLSCGGKTDGISKMVSNLLQIKEDTVVLKNPCKTLKQLIRKIYEDGRSKVLHGTYYDRLESFEIERKHAFDIARETLLSAAICLHEYKGEDRDTAFRSMQTINDK